MTQPQILEGTWDEVNAQLTNRAEELRSYGELRLIVLPKEEPTQSYDEALTELFAEADKLEPTPKPSFTDPQKATISKLIVEKFRKQGLDT